MLETVTLQRIPPVAARRYPLRRVITRPRPGDATHAFLARRSGLPMARQGAMEPSDNLIVWVRFHEVAVPAPTICLPLWVERGDEKRGASPRVHNKIAG